MNVLLVLAVVLILLAVAGFGGAWPALRPGAWIILVIGLGILGLALLI